MTKVALRQEFLAKRNAVTATEITRLSQLITYRFFDYFENNSLADKPASVHIFLPIQRHKEIDTWLIIENLWAKFSQIQISVPVVETNTRQLAHYTIFPDTPLIENRLGIPEPAVGNRHKTDLSTVVAVLVPLLAFDQQGHRVGYGGGYYDRFLAESVPNSRKIGLSQFEPVEQIDTIEPTDVQLDVCITPNQTWLFSE